MTSIAQAPPRAVPKLLGAAALFTVAVLVHGADHARRGADTVATDVFVAGTSAMVLEVGIVLLIVQRHRLAPLLAAVTGSSLAAGYLVVHFLPARSWLSDSLPDGVDISPLSWFAASLEVTAAVALGLAGLAALRQRGGLVSAAEPSPDQGPAADAIRHPLVLAMLVGNLVLLVVSLAQR